MTTTYADIEQEALAGEAIREHNVVALGDGEARPDIAICSVCGWRGPVAECETDEEGDWENGYYKVDLCPKCEDGGSVDDYDFSEYPAEIMARITRILSAVASRPVGLPAADEYYKEVGYFFK